MKENKMSRRSFLKAGAFASAAGMLAAAPTAAHAAAPNVDKAAEEENGLLGIFGGMDGGDKRQEHLLALYALRFESRYHKKAVTPHA